MCFRCTLPLSSPHSSVWKDLIQLGVQFLLVLINQHWMVIRYEGTMSLILIPIMSFSCTCIMKLFKTRLKGIFLISLLSIINMMVTDISTEKLMNATRCFVIAFVSIQMKTENAIFSYLPSQKSVMNELKAFWSFEIPPDYIGNKDESLHLTAHFF